ncbi:MAG: PAS domain-containing methyl-accepting chemotaxis protein [Hyphomicrobium sp.]
MSGTLGKVDMFASFCNRVSSVLSSPHSGDTFSQKLLRDSAVATFVLDQAGQVIVWNRACETLTWVLARDVLGTKNHWRAFYTTPRPCLADLVLSQERESASALYAASRPKTNSLHSMHAENWCEMPNGTRLYLAIDASAILDDTGATVAVIETLRDMTEQHEAKAFSSRLLDEMAVPTFVLDHVGKVILWNKACERLTGLTAQSVLGTRDHWKGFYPTKRACLADLVFENDGTSSGQLYAVSDAASHNKKAMSAENWCDIPRGQRVYLAIDASPIVDETGALIAVVETLRDMTVQKEAQIAVQTAREEQAKHFETIVRTLGAGLNDLASGNLTSRLEHALHEDADKLRTDFNDSVVRLRETIETIIIRANTINERTREISAASDELARRTERQAASLEESSAAANDLAAAVNQTAVSSTKTKDIISAAKIDSEAGAQVTKQTIAAMGRIQESSQKISQIIGVVDEIAFQTNLLALNAGVEAARAGDSGRGFAVVATEVRALAQRSAQAAKEIKELISRSTSDVEAGFKLVNETGEAIDRIMDQVALIDSGIADIAVRAIDQASMLKSVNTAISSIDQTTQQNASMAEEATAVCHTLAEESTQLSSMLQAFKVGPGQRPKRLQTSGETNSRKLAGWSSWIPHEHLSGKSAMSHSRRPVTNPPKISAETRHRINRLG